MLVSDNFVKLLVFVYLIKTNTYPMRELIMASHNHICYKQNYYVVKVIINREQFRNTHP